MGEVSRGESVMFEVGTAIQLISHTFRPVCLRLLYKATVYIANAAHSVAKMPQPNLWETRLVY